MNKDLTRGPVMRSMLWFALPMILGNLLQQCYNIADTLIEDASSAKRRWRRSALRFR